MAKKKKYKIIKDCFVGKKGEQIELWNGMDGYYWKNLNQNTIGCPFIEFDCVKCEEQ